MGFSWIFNATLRRYRYSGSLEIGLSLSNDSSDSYLESNLISHSLFCFHYQPRKFAAWWQAAKEERWSTLLLVGLLCLYIFNATRYLSSLSMLSCHVFIISTFKHFFVYPCRVCILMFQHVSSLVSVVRSHWLHTPIQSIDHASFVSFLSCTVLIAR